MPEFLEMDGSIVDMLWVVIAAAFVFLMQPGFMCLESGMTRSKNSINVAVKNLADFVLSVMTFWVMGYGVMFGLTNMGFFGTTDFFTEIGNDGSIAAFFLFQAMFCGTATTIFSGAVAERMRFSSYLIIVFILSTVIYPVFGHWAWNGLQYGEASGWLGAAGFIDFAGSTVVHSVGGWIALATLLVVGPREGRFDNKNSFFGFNGSNLPLSVLGTCLLWFGWIGFNGGSTLAMNESVPRIVVLTILAGASGALSNLLIGYSFTRISRVGFLINGSLGGLVAITAGCHVVDTVGAVTIGLIAGGISFFTEILLIKVKIDDAVGAIPVHLSCGIWGTLALAFFGDPQLIGTGLAMWNQLFVQLTGVLAAFVISFLLPFFILRKIDRFYPLRASSEDEHIGLNVSEHGATTELIDLFQAMDKQVASSDLSMRMPVEPFTEVGLIAARHNQVMDSLEKAVMQTEAVVSSAKDAIVTFFRDNLEIISINPSGKLMFGHEDGVVLSGISLPDLFDKENFQRMKNIFFKGLSVEAVGKKKCGALFPLEVVVTKAGVGEDFFFIGTFRDITDLKQREESLKKSELRYREFFESTGTATLIIEGDGTVGMVNHQFEILLGYKKEAVVHKMKFTDFLSNTSIKQVVNYREQRLLFGNNDVPTAYESEVVHKDGSIKSIFLNISIISDTKKIIVTLLDLTELREAQNLLTRQRAFFLQLFDASSQAIVALDQNRNITSVNQGFENLFGYKETDVKGKANRTLLVPEELREEMETISSSVLNGNMVKKETSRRHKDGRLIPVSLLGFPIKIGDKLEGIFYIYEDISERKAFERQLYKQAFMDGLTEIPNRILFMERLGRALERRKRRGDFTFAVFLIDLDRFKLVNDSLGHLAGDDLLRQMSNRFLSCIRSGDTVARLGGDEFAILIEDFDKSSKVIEIANRIQEKAQEPFTIRNTDVHVSASVGIVLNTGAYDNAETILRDADIAMYRAKDLGKARFQLFNKKMHQQASESLKMENDLREAIVNGQLRLHYQPIVATASRELIGFEALVRWQRNENDIVSPVKFIPLAEETGLIIPLGEWVLQEACKQLKTWQTTMKDSRKLQINVNISAKQFLQNDLVSTVKNVLSETSLDPRFLKIEITESSIMEGGKLAIDRLNRLKEVGIKLAIDDFGTGYSSLSSLQKFPIDYLKIDRSFIQDVDVCSESREIVKTIITLASNLGLGLVAEGVESIEQLMVLEKMQCDNVQGYYFSRPVPEQDVPGLIHSLSRQPLVGQIRN